MMLELLASPLVLKGLAFLLVGGGAIWLVNKYVTGKGYWWDTVRRAMFEIGHAVLETAQTYVAEISRGRADGVLTAEEKATAFNKAMATAKSNIGLKGLAKLAKVLGLEGDALDAWLGNKIESKVAELKASPLARSPAKST